VEALDERPLEGVLRLGLGAWPVARVRADEDHRVGAVEGPRGLREQGAADVRVAHEAPAPLRDLPPGVAGEVLLEPGIAGEARVAAAREGARQPVDVQRHPERRPGLKAAARRPPRVVDVGEDLVGTPVREHHGDAAAPEPVADDGRVGLPLVDPVGPERLLLPLRLPAGGPDVVLEVVAQTLLGARDEAAVADRDAQQQPHRQRKEDGDERERVIAEVEHARTRAPTGRAAPGA
jgi:hypothetical protein